MQRKDEPGNECRQHQSAKSPSTSDADLSRLIEQRVTLRAGLLCRVDLVHDQQSAGGYKSHSEKSAPHAGLLLQAVQGSIVSRSKGSCTDQESADVDCYQLFELIACADITKWSHRRKVLVANKWHARRNPSHPVAKTHRCIPRYRLSCQAC